MQPPMEYQLLTAQKNPAMAGTQDKHDVFDTTRSASDRFGRDENGAAMAEKETERNRGRAGGGTMRFGEWIITTAAHDRGRCKVLTAK